MRLEGELGQVEALQEDRKELDALLEVIRRHGIRAYYNVDKALDRALSRPYPPELDDVLGQLDSAKLTIGKIKAKAEEVLQREE